MSVVTKCDLCSKTFSETELNTGESFGNVRVLTKQQIGVYSQKDIDCCPVCSKKLLDYIEKEKTK